MDKVNGYDVLDERIGKIESMLEELGQTDRKFLTETIANEIINRTVELEKNSMSMEDLLRGGWKGYDNMTDLELIQDYHSMIINLTGTSNYDIEIYEDDDLAQEVSQDLERAINRLVDDIIL